jgi:hypothetical protein
MLQLRIYFIFVLRLLYFICCGYTGLYTHIYNLYVSIYNIIYITFSWHLCCRLFVFGIHICIRSIFIIIIIIALSMHLSFGILLLLQILLNMK